MYVYTPKSRIFRQLFLQYLNYIHHFLEFYQFFIKINNIIDKKNIKFTELYLNL